MIRYAPISQNCRRIFHTYTTLTIFHNATWRQTHDHQTYNSTRIEHPNGDVDFIGFALLQHLALFCPTCGELWLRQIHSPDPSYTDPIAWTVRLAHCPSHGGHLLDHFQSLESIPRVELITEFLRLSETTPHWSHT